jgi:hypothetical protein
MENGAPFERRSAKQSHSTSSSFSCSCGGGRGILFAAALRRIVQNCAQFFLSSTGNVVRRFARDRVFYRTNPFGCAAARGWLGGSRFACFPLSAKQTPLEVLRIAVSPKRTQIGKARAPAIRFEYNAGVGGSIGQVVCLQQEWRVNDYCRSLQNCLCGLTYQSRQMRLGLPSTERTYVPSAGRCFRKGRILRTDSALLGSLE